MRGLDALVATLRRMAADPESGRADCGGQESGTSGAEDTIRSSEIPQAVTEAVSPDLPANRAAASEAAVPADSDAGLSPAERIRRAKIARCLKIYFQKPVDADALRPWSIMHGLIAFGRDSLVVSGGQRFNAAEYLCQNRPGNGMQILYVGADGRLKTRIGQGVQGHPGQLLAILAQSNVPADQPLTVDGKQFTVRDLIAHEQRDCRSGTELTFKLIAFSHYLSPDARWTNEAGEKWDMQRLLREELSQPVPKGACGGTHRLMAMSFSLYQLERHGMEPVGEWLNAARTLDGYVQRAFSLQNPDGGFSTEFFDGPGRDADPIKRLYATGHILEWLCFQLHPDQLRQPRVTAAVDHILDIMLNAPNFDLDVGPRGHALHALAMYELSAWGSSSNYLELDLAADDPALPVLAREPRTTKATIRPASATITSQAPAERPMPRPALLRRR